MALTMFGLATLAEPARADQRHGEVHPSIALQLTPCFEDSVSELAMTVRVRGMAQSALAAVDLKGNGTALKVRSQHVCHQDRSTIGVWLDPQGGSEPSQAELDARADRLRQLSILEASENFAFMVTNTAMFRFMGEAWADTPKAYDMSGTPSDTGSIQLRSYGVGFVEDGVLGKTVVTSALGNIYTPVENASFTLSLRDTFRIVNGAVDCHSHPNLEVTGTLTNLLLTLASIFVDMGGIYESLADFGTACELTKDLPRKDLLPGLYDIGPIAAAMKLSYVYRRVSLNGSRTQLVFGGAANIQFRTPTTSLDGPSLVRDEGPFRASYWLKTDDMRPPLTVTWSSADATINASTLVQGTAALAEITWDVNVTLNQEVTRTLSVSVVDADGLQRGSTKVVRLKRVLNPELPPLCDLQPQHPDCWDSL